LFPIFFMMNKLKEKKNFEEKKEGFL